MRSFSNNQLIILLGLASTIAMTNVVRSSSCFFLHRKFKTACCETTPRPQDQWIVEIAGAVKKPGIYTFPTPPTIQDAVLTAGGTISDRYEDSLERLDTGTYIKVRALKTKSSEVILSKMVNSKKLALGISIDLNHAQQEDLALIPGLSNALSRRIVQFRKSCGPFREWHDLEKVKGVGPKKIQVCKRYLRLEPSSTSKKRPGSEIDPGPKSIPAASYSPTQLPKQYHRR